MCTADEIVKRLCHGVIRLVTWHECHLIQPIQTDIVAAAAQVV
jgi:hypothetical protein